MLHCLFQWHAIPQNREGCDWFGPGWTKSLSPRHSCLHHVPQIIQGMKCHGDKPTKGHIIQRTTYLSDFFDFLGAHEPKYPCLISGRKTLPAIYQPMVNGACLQWLDGANSKLHVFLHQGELGRSILRTCLPAWTHASLIVFGLNAVRYKFCKPLESGRENSNPPSNL